MQKYINKLKDFNELVMFEHSVFSLPFIFIAMIVAADGWFGFWLLIMGALAAVSARNFAMGLNRYADIDIDVQNPRTKERPSVDGRLDEYFSVDIFIDLYKKVISTCQKDKKNLVIVGGTSFYLKSLMQGLSSL